MIEEEMLEMRISQSRTTLAQLLEKLKRDIKIVKIT